MNKLTETVFYIGVDGGGTKTHAILLNHNLDQIDEAFSGPANIATDIDAAHISICTVIDTILQRNNLSAQEIKIGVGVAGYSVIEHRQILVTKLQDKYTKIILNSDCHIACLAAHNKKDGAIIICGTGVVGYSIYNGRIRQLGGWGFPQGDLGGAAYTGLEIARVLCKAIDGIVSWNRTLRDLYSEFFVEDSHRCKMWLINATPADYAQIAKFVFLKPVDEFSQLLLEYGANEISQLIRTLQKDYPNLSIKLVGGLARLYIDKLQEKFPTLELGEKTPAFGAVLLTL